MRQAARALDYIMRNPGEFAQQVGAVYNSGQLASMAPPAKKQKTTWTAPSKRKWYPKRKTTYARRRYYKFARRRYRYVRRY